MRDKVKDIGHRIYKDIWNYKEVIIIFLIYYIFMHVVFHAFCPLVITTGLPCAGCGMTRAVFFMLTGQFARSWRLNPMALPIILLVVYSFICRYVLGKKIKGVKTAIIVILTGMLIVYVYRMFTIFPNRPPYVYTGGSILERAIPHYKEILFKVLKI